LIIAALSHSPLVFENVETYCSSDGADVWMPDSSHKLYLSTANTDTQPTHSAHMTINSTRHWTHSVTSLSHYHIQQNRDTDYCTHEWTWQEVTV